MEGLRITPGKPAAASLLAALGAFSALPAPHADAAPIATHPEIAAESPADGQSVQRVDLEAVAVRAVAEWLSGSADRLELRPVRGIESSVALPKGRIGLRARPLPARPSHSTPMSRVSVWVDLTVEGMAFRSLLVPVEVHAYRNGWVALRDLPPGTRVSKNDVRREEIEVAASGTDAWHDDPEGRVLKSSALAGRCLTLSQLGTAPAVASGDRVRLLYRTAGIELVADAEALQDGQIGERVRVRIDAARGAVAARVREAGLVELAE